MGSNDTPQVLGQYMHPIIDQHTKANSPFERNYYQPPPLGDLVPRTCPLTDIRADISRPDYTTLGNLQTHGFGIAKHKSALFDSSGNLENDGDVTEDMITDSYYSEVRDLVLKTTGAKQVFVMASALRRGQRAPDKFEMPKGLTPMTPASTTNRETGQSSREEWDRGQPTKTASPSQTDNKPTEKPAVKEGTSSFSRVGLSKPVRIPHLDYTALGARQSLRFQDTGIYKTAVDQGIIAAEDAICKQHGVDVAKREADQAIAQNYNKDGTLGPRYALYSIWRPLHKVGRDPITMAPRKETSVCADPKMTYWTYENRIPGPLDLGGDWIREFALLGARAEELPTPRESIEIPCENSSLKWHYLSGQETDEVFFIQLFDSASLGDESQHSGSPWHGSPELGVVENDQGRESIDVRVIVFW